MSSHMWKHAAGAALALALLAPAARAAKTTTATSSGNWNAAIWNNGAPEAGDTVTINNGVSVTLTNATPALAAFTNNGTLTFSNWDTQLQATDVYVNGTVTHADCQAPTQTPTVSNRVWIVCTNLTVAAGKAINADAVGYRPMGPGTRSAGSRGGASHGGPGGRGGGPLYGDVAAPSQPGSCGQGQSAPNTGTGYGGGAVRIEASGLVTVYGSISANGRQPTGGDQGGGSGGSIHITCRTITGSGTIRANGAQGASVGAWGPGGGGGGRIAIGYEPAQQALVSPAPTLTLSAGAGAPNHYGIDGTGIYQGDPWYGQLGTVHLPDAQLLPAFMSVDFNGVFYGFSATGFTNLTCNGLVQFAASPFDLTVTNDMRLTRPSTYTYKPTLTLRKLSVGGKADLVGVPLTLANQPALAIGGDLSLSNGVALRVYSAPTNGLSEAYGALVSVTGSVSLLGGGAGNWIYPYADATNGSVVRFSMSNLTVAAGSGFNADTLGYFPAGPGNVGANRGGASHGGSGNGPNNTHKCYGSVTAPVTPGSAGGAQSAATGGGRGGGAIWLDCAGDVVLNGTLTANGGIGAQDGGGGSGGSVLVKCHTFTGATGLVRADGARENGGGSNAGGGGGGRVSVVCDPAAQPLVSPPSAVQISVAGGSPNQYQSLYGALGSVNISDASLLPAALTTNFNGIVHGVSTGAWSSLVCDGVVRFAQAAQLTVAGDAAFSMPTSYSYYRPALTLKALSAGGTVTANSLPLVLTGNPTLSCSDSLILTNLATLTIYSGLTNGFGADYGALVEVGEALRIESNCWIYPHCEPLSGHAPLFRVRDLVLATTNCGINADARGYTTTNCPGAGGQRGGGGHGGKGGNGYGAGGATYGVASAPITGGSTGGSDSLANRTAGGGVVRIEASRAVQVNGLITANGERRAGDFGGGAGGSVYIRCLTFGGNGVIRAKGADAGTTGNSGGGGGGRVAVWRMNHLWTGSLVHPDSVDKGLYGQTAAVAGTIYWGVIPPKGTLILLR